MTKPLCTRHSKRAAGLFLIVVTLLVALGSISIRAHDGDEPRAQRYRFTVASEGTVYDLGSWNNVSGLDAWWDIAEYRSGGASNVSRWYLPGNTKYTKVTLTRASSGEIDLVLEWLRHVEASGEPATLLITLRDERDDAVVSWRFEGVQPGNYVVGGRRADGTDIAIETLVLSHEGVSVVCGRSC